MDDERTKEPNKPWRCPMCQPNRGCNSHGKRKPRSDKHKTERKGK